MGTVAKRLASIKIQKVKGLALSELQCRLSSNDSSVPASSQFGALAASMVQREPLLDLDNEPFDHATLTALISMDGRLPGMRDQLTSWHPLTLALIARLKFHEDQLAEPDDLMAEQFSVYGKIERTGKIYFLDGVPFPAGRNQMSLFICLRWRPLFHPYAGIGRVYQNDPAYDRLFATDSLQEAILGISTKKYRDQMADIYEDAPELFIALWLRCIQEAENIVHKNADFEKGTSKIFAAPMKGGLGEQLLIASSIMGEWERLFEIADVLKVAHRVTVEAVRKALDAATSWSSILQRTDEIGRFLQGCALHIRANHRSMNVKQFDGAGSCTLTLVREALENSLAFQKRYKRVESINGERPLRFFNGVELAKFIPAMLEQMHENLMLHQKDGGSVSLVHRKFVERSRKQMLLGIVVTSSICLRTARQMAKALEAKQAGEKRSDAELRRSEARKLNASKWASRYVTAIIIGPEMLDPEKVHDAATYQLLAKLLKDDTGALDNIHGITVRLGQAFKNKTGDIKLVAAECTPAIGHYGWTMGARFEAWFKPDAEIEFLRKCIKPVMYRQDLDDEAKCWERTLSKRARKTGVALNRVVGHIGLPIAHPLMEVHGDNPDIFQPLQFTHKIGSATMSRWWMMSESCVREAALRMAAMSPTSDDPWLNERISSLPKHRLLAKNKNRSGILRTYQVAITRDFYWQRDRSPCQSKNRKK